MHQSVTNMIEHMTEPHEQDDDVNAETGVVP